MRTRALPLILVLAASVAVVAGCGDEPGSSDTCVDSDCFAPVPAYCQGDTRVEISAVGTCADGACSYQTTETPCDYGCTEGRCDDSPCEGVTCDDPPAPSCSDDGAQVTYASEGTCDDADGSCAYVRNESECPDGQRCEDGACVVLGPCEGVVCDEAPAPRCDGTDALEYAAPGTCVDGACEYEVTVRDCAEDGGSCADGACLPDPCADVVCDTPPADFCSEAGIAVTFDAAGTCDADTGECTYPRTRDNCAGRGAGCEDAACVEVTTCGDLICDSPPANSCEGLTAVRYDDVEPRCSDGACEYPVRRVPCGRTDQICVDGDCVDGDPCEGVVCDDVPEPTCDGSIVIASEGGACDGGTCEYPTTETDCADDGLSCVDGACVDLCGDVTCDEAPADACEGDIAVQYTGDGLCDEGACIFDARREDCGVAGGSCVDGACEFPEPCEGVVCDTPPAPTCDGTTVLAFEDTGVCDVGVCRYAPVRTNCAASGRFCVEGACVDADPCDTLVCDDPPEPDCDGDLRIDYLPDGTCDLGECGYPATATDCGAFGGTCVDGACVGGDPCRDVTCDEVPGATCDGASVLSFALPGECVEGECAFEETRTPCAEEAPSLCVGDTAFVRSGHRCEFGICFWDETPVDCGALGQTCVGGACVPVDACRGVMCSTPPPDACDGNRITTWESIGTCTDGVCTYAPLLGPDCAATGSICLGGLCALPGVCEGVDCDECPADICVGSVVSRAACPGTCEDDECSYPREDLVDCADFGESCVDGACVPPDGCEGITCDSPPAPSCEGTVRISSAEPGRCVSGSCIYTDTVENCAVVVGGDCVDGACVVVDPCEGVTCPDGEPACIGDIAVQAPGICIGGACATSITEEECNPASTFCWEGECRSRAECGETRCATAPEPECIGADSDQVLTRLSPGTCDGLVCVWDEEIEDCGALGQTCFEAECIDYVDPGPGDIEIQEIHIDPAGADGDREWIEIVNLTERTFDLSGMVVADDDGQSFTIPEGTLLTPRRWAILAADPDTVEAAVLEIDWGGAAVFSLDEPEDEIELRVGAVVVDRVAWDATWPIIEGETIGLDVSIEDPDNGLAASWCATGFPDGTAGVPNRPCPSAPDAVLEAGDLTITELMPGSSVAAYDYVEIRNDGARALDLSAVEIAVGGSTWALPDGTTVARDGWVVIAGSADAAPSVDVVIAGFTLPDAGTITLAPGADPLDVVTWDATWPWDTDVSMSFSGSFADDNDDAAFWCAAWLPFDDGRFGNPDGDAVDCATPTYACEGDDDCGEVAAFCLGDFRIDNPPAGTCVEGFCDYSDGRTYTDCAATGQTCDIGACVD